jgi:hypothetical protein
LNNIFGKISLEDAYKIIEYNPREKSLDNLFEEFKFIDNDLLKILGINNTIIFMNSIFDDVSILINNIEINSKEIEFREIEKKLDEKIKEKILKYRQSMEEYFTIIDKSHKNIKNTDKNNDKKPQLFYDMLIEKQSFYNDKKMNKDFPYISYLTSTNFCTLEDFKNQYLYFENDEKSYPLIDSILKNKKIFKIIEFIPILNNFINHFYNELSMNINEEKANERIKNYYYNDKLKEFNNSLQIFYKIYSDDSFNMVINEDCKVSEVINVNKEGNKIFEIYRWIIKEYNNFLETTNFYAENKK